MAKSLTFGSRATGESLDDAGPTYIMFGTNVEGDQITTTHLTAQQDVTLGNAFVRVLSNGLSNACTFAVLEEEVASSLSISVGAGLTGLFEDTTHTVLIEAGNRFQWKATPVSEAGTHTIVYSVIGCELRPSGTNTISLFACKSLSSSFLNAGTTYFHKPNGERTGHTSETDAKLRMRMACTVYYMRVAVAGNTASGNATFKSRINGADGAGGLQVVVDATQTGTFEESDTSHTETIAVGDDFNWTCVLDAGTGTLNLESVACQPTTTTNQYMLGGGGAGTGLQFNTAGSSETTYCALNCEFSTKGTTEADVQVTPKIPVTVVSFSGNVTTNTRAAGGTMDITLRKDAGDSSLTLHWNAAATGFVEDTTSAETFAASTNAASIKLVAGSAASGQIRVQSVASVLQVYGQAALYHQRQQQGMAA